MSDSLPHNPTYRVGVDIGGTFTDIVFLSEDGRLLTKKISSSVDNYALAIVQGLSDLFKEHGLVGHDVDVLRHGTTVGSNAILEHKGVLTGLICSEGFRDILEIRNLRRPHLYNIVWNKPQPLVERYLRLPVDERINAQGEVEIALVMGRAAEDRARAIFRQDEIGDPDGHLTAVERVDDPQPCVEADLLCLFDLGLGRSALAAFRDKGGGGRIGLGKGSGDRVVGRNPHETGTEQGVGPGGIDLQPTGCGGGGIAGPCPGHLQTLRATDPVLLHQPDLVGPAAFQLLQAFDQVVGIVGDAQEPLVQLAFLDHGPRAPAPTVDHLFIGQNRLIHRIPVHHGIFFINQAFFV